MSVAPKDKNTSRNAATTMQKGKKPAKKPGKHQGDSLAPNHGEESIVPNNVLAVEMPIEETYFFDESSLDGVQWGDWRWGFDSNLTEEIELAISQTIELSPGNAAEKLLAPLEDEQNCVSLAMLILATAYQLPSWIKGSDPDVAAPLVEFLASVAAESTALTSSKHCVERQLLAVELTALMACYFPEHKLVDAWNRSAADGLAQTFHVIADDSGVPMASHWQDVVPCAASMVRCRMLSQAKEPLWSSESQAHWNRLAEHIARLHLQSGRFLCEPSSHSNQKLSFLKALVSSGLPASVAQFFPASARKGLSFGKKRSTASKNGAKSSDKKSSEKPKKPSEASFQSDDAYCVALRTGWNYKQSSLTFLWHEPVLQGVLKLFGEDWFCGDWNQTLSVDGKQLAASGDWDSTCYVADDDVCYIELEQEFDDQWRVQRQFCLDRKGTFAFFADAVLGVREATLSYAFTLPAAQGLRCKLEKETHEAWLTKSDASVLAMPLAFPEWRQGSRNATLELQDGALHCAVQRHGSALYSPLWLEFNASQKAPRTWRQLTVAENRRVLPSHEAVGYRVQVGKRQYVVYRSLAPVGNRTVLGCNTVSEFILGRFTSAGLVEPLIEIE